MDTFVSLPVYEGLKSYQTLKYDDIKENSLLYISCFQLKKHLKLIERIEEKSLLYIFYQVLVYYYTKNITERFFRIDRLISVLDKNTLLALRTDFADSCKEFDKLTKKI